MSELVQKLSEAERAYLAGFIDGEGHLGATKSNRSVRIRINNTSEDVLRWIQARTGGHLRFSERKNDRWQPVWSLDIARRDQVRQVLEAVRPFLIVKARQAQLMLDFIRLADSLKPAHPARVDAWYAMEGMNQPLSNKD